MSQTQSKPDRGPTTGTPRWVKVFGIIAIALVPLFIMLKVVTGGEFGAGGHSPTGGDPGGRTSLSGAREVQAVSGGEPVARMSISSLGEQGVRSPW